MVTQRLLLAVVLSGVAACKPELAGRPSLVESERVLALRSSPAEAAPGARVSYDALFVGPQGDGAADALSWALCNERKALTESGTIARACLQLSADALLPLTAESGKVEASLPRDACETFGPTPKTPKPGEPSLRPVDPDTTGGYYQPVRVAVSLDEEPERYAVGVTRLSCALGGATQELSAEYNRRRRPNENPRLESLAAVREGEQEQPLTPPDDESPLAVGAGESLTLFARWASCPEEPSCGDGICSVDEQDCQDDCREPRGCGGSEPYVYFDPLTRELGTRRELMRVAWFASEGAFDHERTGQLAGERLGATSQNVWHAPDRPADVRLWVVLRDDRGGVGWSSYRLRVE